MAALILASGSPRRRAFLTGAGVPHLVRPTGVDESLRSGEAPTVYAARLAGEKAEAAWAARRSGEPGWVLTADTVVAADGVILDKPASAAEAASTLRALSGRWHQVHTAWAVRGDAGLVAHEVTTAEVLFRALTDAEIEAYVGSGDPLDKAGAYGIQGEAGRFVERVEGPYAAVVGLPIESVLARLVRLGVVAEASEVETRLRGVRGRIAAAESGNGLAPGAVRLVGVSKRQPLERVAAGVAAGLRDLGENYVQAWRDKVDDLPAAVRWHFIGHLQRNKVKLLDERVVLVHGVDSVRTAEALAKLGRSQGRVVRFLAQVNVGDEDSKAGLATGELGDFLRAMEGLEGAAVEGLMTIPPPTEQAGARRWFAALRALRDRHATASAPLSTLSMGMSGDYEAAIAEGATHVRVGSAIFGTRAS